MPGDPALLDEPERPPRLALIIGIDGYGQGVATLQNAVADARAIADVLVSKCGLRRDEVGLEVGGEVTRDRLRSLFTEELPAAVTDQHDVIVYFAGHGHAVPDKEEVFRGYLLGSDSERERLDTFLPVEDIRGALRALPCKHLLVLLDCCFAGTFAQALHREVEVPPMGRRRYEGLRRRRSFQLIASAAHDELALDAFELRSRSEALADDHSPFAAAVLEGLRGGADRDRIGIVTATDLFVFIRKRLEEKAPDTSMEQTPNLWALDWHQGGELMFEIGEAELPEPDLGRNPYRGLEPFRREDKDLFFGRDEVAKRLAEHVGGRDLTVVLGPSGVGKSSLIHAGLLPRLDPSWTLLGPLRPARSPLSVLASIELPRESAGSRPTILVIDQLEEVLTMGTDPAHRAAFVSALRTIVERRETGVEEWQSAHGPRIEEAVRKRVASALKALLAARARLILGLRSDYEPPIVELFVLRSGDMPPVEGPADEKEIARGRWDRGRFHVPAMRHEELRLCVEMPAAKRYLSFDLTTPPDRTKPIVETLLDEVDQMPGALPLLSTALSAMFEAHVHGDTPDGVLGWPEYRAIGGGAVGALQKLAEDVHLFADRSREEQIARQATMRRLALRMVAFEGGELARRRVPWSEIEQPDQGEQQRIWDVHRALSDARLVVGNLPSPPRTGAGSGRSAGAGSNAGSSSEEGSRRAAGSSPGAASSEPVSIEDEPYYEPAHDWLVKGWPRLRRWVDEEQEGLLVQRRLTQAAADWGSPRGARRSDLLWDDERVAALFPPRPAWSLEAVGLRFRVKGALATLPPYALSAREAEFVKASLQARRARLLGVISAVTAAIVVLSALAIVAWVQRGQKEDALVVAGEAKTAAEIAAGQEKERARDARDAGRMGAVRSPGIDLTTAAAVLLEVEAPEKAEGWIQAALDVLEQPTSHVARERLWQEHGGVLEARVRAGRLELLFMAVTGDSERTSHRWYAPDGSLVGPDVTIQRGKVNWSYSNRSGALTSEALSVDLPLTSQVAWDGRRWLAVAAARSLRRVDVLAGTDLPEATLPKAVSAVAYSPDGARLAVAAGETILAAPAQGAGWKDVAKVSFLPEEILFDPTGKRIAARGGRDVALIEVALIEGAAGSAQELKLGERPEGMVFDEEGTSLAVVSDLEIEPAPGTGKCSLSLHRLGEQGRWTRVWKQSLSTTVEPVITFLPGKQREIVIATGREVVRVDVKDGRRIGELRHPASEGSLIAAFPQGDRLATLAANAVSLNQEISDHGGVLRTWSLDPAPGYLVLKKGSLHGAAAGRRAATFGARFVEVWDGAQSRVLDLPGGEVLLGVPRIGDQVDVVVGARDRSVSWRTLDGDGEVPRALVAPPEGGVVVHQAWLSADGRWIAVSVPRDKGGVTLKLWEKAPGAAPVEAPSREAAAPIEQGAFSSDGRVFAAVSGGRGMVFRADARGWNTLREGAEKEIARVLPTRSRGILGATLSGALLDWSSDDAEPVVWARFERQEIERMAVDDEERTLAIGTRDGAVVIVDLATRTSHVLRGHKGSIDSLAFRPDGRTLVSTSREGGQVRWWAVAGARLIAELPACDKPVGAVFDPSGARSVGTSSPSGGRARVVVACGEQGRVWLAGIDALRERLRERKPGCVPPEERRRLLGEPADDAQARWKACRARAD